MQDKERNSTVQGEEEINDEVMNGENLVLENNSIRLERDRNLLDGFKAVLCNPCILWVLFAMMMNAW